MSTASGGVRSRTIATAAERSAAWRRKSHGTWSAYRAAEVTKIQRSAAASSWAARARLDSSTESTSGASRIASPSGTVGRRTSWSADGSVVGRWTRSRSGSRRSWPNHPASAGLCTSTGERVVGRSTPGSVTRRADERVDQRRLAGAGRAAHHRQQRRVEGHHPRDDVVLELVDHLAQDGRGARRRRAAPAAARPAGGRRAGAPAPSASGCPRPVTGSSLAHRWGTTCPGKAMNGRTCAIRATYVVPARGEVGRRGAAQVAAVQEPELDHGLLVVAHRPQPLRATHRLGVRATLAAGAEVDDPADVGGRDQAARRRRPSSAAASMRRSERRAHTARPIAPRNAGAISTR